MAKTCYLLSPRGFCSGVSRATSMVQQVLKLYNKIYILEDVIHNKMFMKSLYDNGIVKVDSIDDVPEGATIMFSAHGVSPSIFEKAEKRGLTIVDATCPIVQQLQKSFKKEADLGKTLVVIGNRNHAEIIGLLGFAGNADTYVVYNEMDIDLLPDLSNKDVVYFTQTTLDYQHVLDIVNKLKKKFPNIRSNSENNICFATRMRQAAVRKIANSVDLMIIVGSQYSSNAKRLCEVAQNSCSKKVILIESKDHIKESDLEGIETIAISAAASTPEKLVQDLVDYLKDKFKDLEIRNLEISPDECSGN